MITLSNGYFLPETNDKGTIVFPALEANITRLNNHVHDGVDSEKLNTASIEPLSISLAAGSWVSVGDGLYKQTVTLPGALSFDTAAFTVKLGTSGHNVYPSIEKISASQYDIFTNDNTEGFEVIYL